MDHRRLPPETERSSHHHDHHGPTTDHDHRSPTDDNDHAPDDNNLYVDHDSPTTTHDHSDPGANHDGYTDHEHVNDRDDRTCHNNRFDDYDVDDGIGRGVPHDNDDNRVGRATGEHAGIAHRQLGE